MTSFLFRGQFWNDVVRYLYLTVNNIAMNYGVKMG